MLEQFIPRVGDAPQAVYSRNFLVTSNDLSFSQMLCAHAGLKSIESMQ